MPHHKIVCILAHLRRSLYMKERFLCPFRSGTRGILRFSEIAEPPVTAEIARDHKKTPPAQRVQAEEIIVYGHYGMCETAKKELHHHTGACHLSVAMAGIIWQRSEIQRRSSR